jgi:hypothetical protein
MDALNRLGYSKTILQQAKQYLEISNLTKNSKSYTVFINDKPNYNKWNKVYNKVFYDIINTNILKHFIVICQIIYQFIFIEYNNFERKTILPIVTFKHFECQHKTLIFNVLFLIT